LQASWVQRAAHVGRGHKPYVPQAQRFGYQKLARRALERTRMVTVTGNFATEISG
jgi:hypothetical protein